LNERASVLSDQSGTDRQKLLTCAVMERQLIEGFALCNAFLQESDKSLNPTLVIVMFTLIHNFHFFLMVKYIPKEFWPEKLLLLGAKYGIKE
tara:strand:+ start:109 stop:384 length:276 start_codon:yes stop_codon:yes gene_type:complete